jgi:O-antigen ligase
MVSIKELYKYITALLLFLIVASLSAKEKSVVIKCIILTATFVSSLAMYQYFFGFKHISEYIAKNNITDQFILDYVSRKRVFTPFITPGVLGGYLAMLIPLTLMDKKKFWLIIPLSFALLFTRSVGAIFSLFLGLTVYFYLIERLGKKEALLVLGLFIIAVLVLIIRFVIQKEYTHPVFSSLMRLNYWKDTLGIIKLSPLFGVGIGNFNIPYSRYAHNSYLQFWAEAGILSVISFLWIIFAVFKSAFKNIEASSDRNRIACLSFASFVFLAHNFIDFTFFLPEVAFIWWIILGLILSKE